ncbi:MAG: AmmeMemoRadiSam system protein B, partial [Planctomycetota bacterium]
ARCEAGRQRTAVGPEDVQRIAEDLEERYCVEGERVEAALARRRQEFDRLTTRPAVHAGSPGYPAEGPACKERLDGILGASMGPDPRALLGLIAPHIDLERGRRGYSSAYGVLAQAPSADLYVILGTGHQCPGTPLVPSLKDFATPLGVVPTDRDFVSAVASSLGEAASFEQEFLHKREHSVEFQALFLRHCLDGHPFRIAPFLTGRFEGVEDERVERVVEVFASEIAKRRELEVCLIAGADMSHLGPYFGDSAPVDQRTLEEVGKRDRASLAMIEQGLVDEFFSDVEGDGNPRRVCGTVPMYLVSRITKALDPSCTVEVLDYAQAVSPDASQVVTFGSVAFRAGP